MEKLDLAYLAELVEKTKAGGSNAFAELYTATYQREYSYALNYLKDTEKAKQALEETYVRALKDIVKLNDSSLVLGWLYSINFAVCHELSNESEGILIDSTSYTLNQLTKNLPLTEAQLLIMHYYQGISYIDIKKMIGLSRSEIKINIRSGKQHLRQLLGK